jgi:hypothetical protein
MRRHTTHWSRGGLLHAGWVETCAECGADDLGCAVDGLPSAPADAGAEALVRRGA